MPQTVVIIDYGSGNLRSVEKAFQRAARERNLARGVVVSDDPETIAAADRLVLPGVGAFAACAAGLAAGDGVLEAIEHAALIERRPFLGVCVGMQLLADQGLEFGRHQGLGWVSGAVIPLTPRPPDFRAPHMGWNKIALRSPHPLFAALEDEAFYFAHSYHFKPENTAHVIAVSQHGGEIVAAIGRDNLLGVQFHPEKSQRAGVALIANFLQWAPT